MAWDRAHGPVLTRSSEVTRSIHQERVRFLAFPTWEGAFDRSTDNQGWYSDTEPSSDLTDNYFVGSPPGNPGVFRDFFTFDLSRLDGQVQAATLVVRRYRGTGDATEVLGLFSVATGARRLNNNSGVHEDIFRDLGAGQSYGRFSVSTVGRPEGLVHLKLNQAAIADINAARGTYFSVGGALLTDDGNGDGLFGYSRGEGVQWLVVQLRERPSIRAS